MRIIYTLLAVFYACTAAATTIYYDNDGDLEMRWVDITGEIRMEWISVEDRLPLEDEPVIAWNGEHIEKAFIMRFDNGLPVWSYYDWMEWEGVTHWMPLPSPPE